MLTADEESSLRHRLLTEVVPHPRSILTGFVDGVITDSDPEDFTAPIEEFAEALMAEFPDDTQVEAAAEQLRAARWEWIEEHPREERPHVDGARYRSLEPVERRVDAERSVFDDLVAD